MHRVLIVDDADDKAGVVEELVLREFGEAHVDVVVASSLSDAAVRMQETAYDLLVVDLNLPVRDGDTPSEEGGLRLLKQVIRGTNGLMKPTFVVGLTAFEELAASSLSEFHKQGWALVTYSAASAEWEEPIANQCRQVADTKARYESKESNRVDVCICTALADPEMTAVLAAMSDAKKLGTVDSDGARYQRLRLPVADRRVECVLATATEMGNAASASVAANALARFRPRMMLLLGICAGIRARIGDVVFAENSLNYESGKWKQEADEHHAAFSPEPRFLPSSGRMLSAFRHFESENLGELGRIASTFRGQKVTEIPELRIGSVACGSAVIESHSIVDQLNLRHRKLEGLEMESYGFYMACKNAYPELAYGMIKAVCDEGRPPKEDKYQEFAAYLSAELAVAFIRHEVGVSGGLLD